MNKNSIYHLVLLVSGLFTSLVSSSSYAEIAKGMAFNYKAWEIVCDNTLTCRMAGYDNDDLFEQNALSILLERKAGADQYLTGSLVLATYDDVDLYEGEDGDEESEYDPNYNQELDNVILHIGQKSYGPLQLTSRPKSGRWIWTFNQPQLEALIEALKGEPTIKFETDVKLLDLSNSGFNAVMLKMDEFQGRVNTPTAIIKKGDLPASNNYAPIPPPVIRAAPVTTPERREELTREELLIRFPNFIENEYTTAECSIYNDDETSQYIDWYASLIQLDSQYSLLEIPCWFAAYNEGNGYWLIKNEETKLITTLANGYADGRLFSSHRGRGLADCMSYENWTWNGRDFIVDSQINTGQCRLITLGGTWQLPTFVTDIRRNK